MTINIPSPDGKRMYSVNTNDPTVARETVRRQLAKEWLLANPSGKVGRPTAMDALTTGIAQGGTLGLNNVVEGLGMGGVTGIKNFMEGGDKHTFGMGDAYKATRDIQAEKEQQSPFLSGLGGVIGGFRMPGAERVADFVGGKVGAKFPGLLGGLMTSKALPAVTARAITAGAPIGAVAGAAAAKPGQEAKGAITGAVVGGGVGGAVSGGVPGAARVVKIVGKPVVQAVGDVVRGAGRISGLTTSDTGAVAMKEVVRALRADGATPDIVKKIQTDWITTGASPPNLLDIASKLPSGGGATRRVIQGASMTDLGSGAAHNYAEDVAAALPENAERVVSRLTPNQPQTASKLQGSIKATRAGNASTQYPEAYNTPVKVTPDVQSALADDHGIGAIQDAIDEATARRDYASADRLQALLTNTKAQGRPGAGGPARVFGGDAAGGDVPLPRTIPQVPPDLNVTAGDLDRVRLNMNQRANNLLTGDKAKRGVAGGLFDRANQIDAALDRVPELAPARATYKGLSNQMEAVGLGKGVLGPTEPGQDAAKASSDYIEALQERMAGATPGDNPYPVSADDIRQAAGVGYRQGAVNAIEDQSAGATGVIRKLATSPRQVKIQEATFNPEGTDDTASTMREALQNEMLKLQNVRRNDPGFGSQSMDRAMSLTDIAGSIPTTPLGWAMKGLTALHQGVALSPQEREAIVHTGLGDLDMSGLIKNMHPDVHPIMDALDRIASSDIPSYAQGAAQLTAPGWDSDQQP